MNGHDVRDWIALGVATVAAGAHLPPGTVHLRRRRRDAAASVLGISAGGPMHDFVRRALNAATEAKDALGAAPDLSELGHELERNGLVVEAAAVQSAHWSLRHGEEQIEKGIALLAALRIAE